MIFSSITQPRNYVQLPCSCMLNMSTMSNARSWLQRQNQTNIYSLCLPISYFKLSVSATKRNKRKRGKIRMYEGKIAHAIYTCKYCSLRAYWQLCIFTRRVLIHKNLHRTVFFLKNKDVLTPNGIKRTQSPNATKHFASTLPPTKTFCSLKKPSQAIKCKFLVPY